MLEAQRPAPQSAADPASVQTQALPHLLTAQLQSTASFLFCADEIDERPHPAASAAPALHDDILRAQARLLAAHAACLYDVLKIDDIYAHPLIGRGDILSGHRLRAFAGAPLRDPQQRLIGVICTVDTTARRWSDRDIGIVRRIVAQFTSRRLS